MLLVMASAGCSSTPASHSGSTPTIAATPSASPTTKSFLNTAPGWRQVALDAAWKRALAKGVVALSRRVSLVPFALGNDGRTFFASLYSKSYAGVVRVDAATSRFTPIRRFPNATNDQADGGFDGRWLVWDEYHSLSGSDDFTTWSWDSHSGRVRQIGAATRGPSGAFWPSSWQPPDVRDGLATWEQGTGPNGLGEVHVVDLASGRDRIVRHGHPGQSLLVDGGLVVWPESMKQGALTVMRAADARTGRPVATPPALRHLRGVGGLVTDGAAIACADPNWSSLWWSPSLATPAVRLFTAPGANHIDNSIRIAGRYLCFGVAPHTYLADTVSRRYVEIGPGGYACLDANSLVMLMPSAVKANHAITDIIFLPLSSLPAIPNQ